MLYTLLKPLINLSLRAYFRKINVIGKENLLESGPTLFVSNHPNSFIDPLIMVILLKRELHFIAGAEWFGKGIKNWIFSKQFNMIPVTRPWLVEGTKVDNEDMFLECYKSLQAGNCILIYPEGSSMTIDKIRDLKTGAARIKIGTEAFTQNKVNVSVVPVGLNYTREHRFQSDLTVKIGPEIDFEGIGNAGIDGENNVREMTDLIQEKLKEQIIHIENQELKPVIKDVSRLFTLTLKKEYEIDQKELDREFHIKKEIVNAVEYFEEKNPELVKKMDESMSQYFEKVDSQNLEDQYLDDHYRKGILPLILKLIIGLPFAIIGFIINFIPYQVTYSYFRLVWLPKMMGEYKQGQLNPSFVGSLAFTFSMLIFMIWYAVIIVIPGIYTGIWWNGVIALLGGYVSGRILLYYLKWFAEFSEIIKFNWIVLTKRDIVKELVNDRSRLIEQLLKFRDLYLKAG